MRMPPRPPKPAWEIDEHLAILMRAKELPGAGSPSVKGRYLHWDKLRRIQPPDGWTHEQWWVALKSRRLIERTFIGLRDRQGGAFSFNLPEPIPEQLHDIDQQTAGRIELPMPLHAEDRDRYVLSSLVEEAIRSSQIEGAATTRRVARDMIRANRKPRDHGERMIFNNYVMMQRARELRGERLTPAMVLELHRLVTQDTLDDPDATGRLRPPGTPVYVMDNYNEILHEAPEAEELPARLAAMCAFANGAAPDKWVHPIIRSIVLHFWLAYDHPFIDGNGRTARALFYWSMLRHGYWLCEFLSISQVIFRAPARYLRAFLYTETDDNDLNYFILYHLEIIRKAITAIHDYVQQKAVEERNVERKLGDRADLNRRQHALLAHALRHPNARYTIESHRNSHGVVYETARTDLLNLAKRGFLTARKRGRTWFFTPAVNLTEQLGKQLPEE